MSSTSLHQIAAALNKRGITTARGDRYENSPAHVAA
jgi:hypothetical protein